MKHLSKKIVFSLALYCLSLGAMERESEEHSFGHWYAQERMDREKEHSPLLNVTIQSDQTDYKMCIRDRYKSEK